MELKMGNSCGSCIHTNKPKTPRDHAAHYEVAKTERWCFKHNCHITRETSCDDHEGINRSAKTSFSRIIKFNERQKLALEVVALIGDKEVKGDYNRTFYVKNNWIYYYYDNRGRSDSDWKIKVKESSSERELNYIIKALNAQL